MNTCGNCRRWRPDDKDADTEDGYGVCGRIKMRKETIHYTGSQGDYTHTRDDEPAVTQDGSDYWSAVLCRKDFGCVLWESK